MIIDQISENLYTAPLKFKRLLQNPVIMLINLSNNYRSLHNLNTSA